MNYKEYMDRQSVDEGFHKQLLDLEIKQKKRRPWKSAAVAAALCCVIGLGAWGVTVQMHHGRDLPLNVTMENGETLPKLHFRSPSGSGSADSIALPEGYFYRDMTEEQIASLWSMDAAELAETGMFSDLTLIGQIIYDGQGVPWQVEVRGKNEDTAEKLFLRLSPDRLPPECVAGMEQWTNNVYGTAVAAHRRKTTESEEGAGRWDYDADFLHVGAQTVGMRIELLSYDSAAAEERIERIVYYSLREDVLRVLQLTTEEIPMWFSENPSEAEAYAEEGFAEYLPTMLPEGYIFSGAWREKGEDRDYLTVEWTYGTQYISVHIDALPGEVTPVDIDETEAYDLRCYNSTDKPDPPQKYWGIIENPVFRAEDLSEEVIDARLYRYPDETEDQADFQVLYNTGALVRIHGRGTAEEIWQLAASAPAFGAHS